MVLGIKVVLDILIILTFLIISAYFEGLGVNQFGDIPFSSNRGDSFFSVFIVFEAFPLIFSCEQSSLMNWFFRQSVSQLVSDKSSIIFLTRKSYLVIFFTKFKVLPCKIFKVFFCQIFFSRHGDDL